jgi:hypothetical protein
MTEKKTKEQIIYEMCIDYRHDYGLRKLDTDPPWTAGLTEKDAMQLYKIMEDLYNTVLEPKMNEKDRPK